MKLIKARVRLFRNIVDSGEVGIQNEVTALVGKNESGKTAFLQALYRLNPAHQDGFDVLDDYPRWRLRRDERDAETRPEQIVPIEAWFEVEASDVEYVQAELGFRVKLPQELCASMGYDGNRSLDLTIDNEAAVKALLNAGGVKPSTVGATSIDGLRIALDDGSIVLPEENESLQRLLARATKEGDFMTSLEAVVWERVPKFFLFDQYSTMPGRVKLQELVDAQPEALISGMRTALALINMSGGHVEEFLADNYERRVADLEASANDITQQVFEYWSQNRTLSVKFDIENANEAVPQGGQMSVVRYLQVRIRDDRHQMTTPYARRSTGFRWFFSFLAAFDEYQRQENLIVLLDEPGLGLHGRAQGDLLRFISERLASQHQVLYTTHSPFMIVPAKLDGVRLVEDSEDLGIGSTITSDIRVRDKDTVFPLLGALGYDIAQGLFVAAHNVVVEGVSDYIFVNTLSDFMAQNGREGLKAEWSIVPVGGASKIPTFAALLGAHLDMTILLDNALASEQRIMDLVDAGVLNKSRVLSVASLLGRKRANIEDVFTPGEYLRLYNGAFGTNIKVADLKGSDSIVARVERHIGDTFSHAEPAVHLLTKRDAFLSRVASTTLDRFEGLFRQINQTFPT